MCFFGMATQGDSPASFIWGGGEARASLTPGPVDNESMLSVQSYVMNCSFGEDREKRGWHPTKTWGQHDMDRSRLGFKQLTPDTYWP